MRVILLLLTIVAVALTLRLDRQQHADAPVAQVAEDVHLEKIMEHLQSYNSPSTPYYNNYQNTSANNSASGANNSRPGGQYPSNGQTYNNGKSVLENQKNTYLAKFPPGPTVDYTKATQMADFFGNPMGAAILNYFNARTVQADGTKGLNYYRLNDRNFRLWMSIKIIADADTNLYARSIAMDQTLFAEFVTKVQL